VRQSSRQDARVIPFHLLKGPEAEDHTFYASRTVWEAVRLAAYKRFTKHVNGLKTTFPKWPETNPCSPLFNKTKRQAMSIIIRIVFVATCAYTGLVVAGIQFPDLPDPYEMSQK
jgi:hypothetical protein